MKQKRIDIIAGLVFLIGFACSVNSPDGTAGNSTQTGNPGSLSGILYNPDGTFAANVPVQIRLTDQLPDTTGLTPLPKKLADTATIMTDDSGRFVFDTTLDSGTYFVTAVSGLNLVLIDSVSVKYPADTTVVLPPDTLKPAGSVKGILHLAEGGDPRKIMILVFNAGKVAFADSTGKFEIPGLAEASYHIRFVSLLDNYGVLDTFSIRVISKDTNNMDTVDIPYTGVPTPKKLSAKYDAVTQAVTLSWNESNPLKVGQYYIYRRNVDSNTVFIRLNTAVVSDTVYKDTSCIGEHTYEYRVSALDTAGIEGNVSTTVSTFIASLFSFADTIAPSGINAGELTSPNSFAVNNEGYAIFDGINDSAYVDLFDTAGAFRSSFFVKTGLASRIFGKYLKSGNLLVVLSDSAYSFDKTGTKIASWATQFDFINDIAITESNDTVLLYALSSMNLKVTVKTLAGQIKADFPITEGYSIEATKNGDVLLLGNNQIHKYSGSGNFIRSFGSTGAGIGQFDHSVIMTIDSAENLFVLETAPNNRLQVFTQEGVFIAKCSTYPVSNPVKMIFDGNMLLILDADTPKKLFRYVISPGTEL